MKLFPGLSFSWKRAVGITRAKSRVRRTIGFPTTRGGLERKIGRSVLRLLLGRRRR